MEARGAPQRRPRAAAPEAHLPPGTPPPPAAAAVSSSRVEDDHGHDAAAGLDQDAPRAPVHARRVEAAAATGPRTTRLSATTSIKRPGLTGARNKWEHPRNGGPGGLNLKPTPGRACEQREDAWDIIDYGGKETRPLGGGGGRTRGEMYVSTESSSEMFLRSTETEPRKF